MVFRSLLAGVVVGIVLYTAEPILSAILFALSVGGNFRQALAPAEVQWYQFLPFSIGDSALAAASATRDPGGFQFTAVPIEQALAAVALYLVISIGISMAALRRAEVAG